MKSTEKAFPTKLTLGPVQIQKRGLISLTKAKKTLKLKDGDVLEMAIENGRIVLTPVDLVPRDERYLRSEAWTKGIYSALEDLDKGRYQTFDDTKKLLEELQRED